MIETIALLLAACLILHRAVLLISIIKKSAWRSKLCFFCMALSIGFMVAGSFAIAAGIHWGAALLLFGVAGFFLFDRRQQYR